MKKYNLSEIMKQAWRRYKELSNNIGGPTFAECLRRVWAYAKRTTEKAEELRNLTIESIVFKAQLVADKEGYTKVVVKEWNNYDKSRTYISMRRYTPSGNLREASCGYWDNIDKQYVVNEKRGEYSVI